jgi:hypothetical protein
MKREVKRNRTLPAFRLDMGELELLWGKVLQLFDDPAHVRVSLTVELRDEKLDFNSLEELRTYQSLPATLKDFSLRFSQGEYYVSIGGNGMIGSLPEVRTSGLSEAWCAGAVETVSAFMSQHRIWYHWFLVAPVGWLFLLTIYVVPIIAVVFIPKDFKIPIIALAAWVTLTFTLFALYLSRAKFLPICALELRQENNFLRKYTAELTILLAVVSLVLTVIGWFFTK